MDKESQLSDPEYDRKLKKFETLCRQKDVMIQSLQRGLEEQKLKRNHEAIVVEEKATKIKQWVTSRLRELEEQNEKLRTQNLKCSRQLQVLKTCAQNTAYWRNSLLSNSVSGALPIENLNLMTDRGSGDSGNTSDVPPDYPILEWPHVRQQQQTASYEQILSRSTNTTMYGHMSSLRERNKENLKQIGSYSNPGSPRSVRNPRSNKIQLVNIQRTHSLPRDGHRNCCQAGASLPRYPKKPVPMPRNKTRNEPTAYLISDDILTIERDSLEVNSRNQSTMEIRESMCNLVDRDSLNRDYVNIADFPRYVMAAKTGTPPQPPAHRRRPSWEEKLHSLAQQCLGSVPEDPKTRDSISTGLPSARCTANEQRSSSRTTSSDSHKLRVDSSGNDIQLPVFTTRHGKLSKAKFNSSSSGGSCVSPQPKVPSLKRSDPSSTDLDPDSSPQPYTSGSSHEFRSSGGSVKNRLDFPIPLMLSPRRMENEGDTSSDDGDYAVPPDAYEDLGPVGIIEKQDENGMQISVIAERIEVEKSGYLVSVSDSRIKSLKRRWCLLKNEEFMFFKSQKEQVKSPDQPLVRISLDDVTSVTKLEGKSGVAGFEIITSKTKHRFTAENKTVTEEWIKAFNQALKSFPPDQYQNGEVKNATLKGWLTKVKYGHCKKCYTVLVENRLLFFKSNAGKSLSSQINVKGAQVQEVVRSSDESGSDDGLGNTKSDGHEHSLTVQLPQQDPLYLIFNTRELKERWLYHLKLASRDGELYGSPFEVLIQRLMVVDGNPGSELWFDVLLQTAQENPNDPMISLNDEKLKKGAISIAKSCYLFSTVPMLAGAIQYHVDLAQSILSQALSDRLLGNELLCQLIKLTNGAIRSSVQAWKLLALAVSSISPNQYPVLWLLRKHLNRWSCLGGDESCLSQYCLHAVERCIECGPRKERPSKLEALSLLTRNPSAHKMPHSIAIETPAGGYQIAGFDGSSSVNECVYSLCCDCKMREPICSGYALYSDDPCDIGNDNQIQSIVINNKDKLCDVISRWEQKMKENNKGKIPTAKMIKLSLKQRYYWSSLMPSATDAERVFLVYRFAEQLRKGHIPASPELAQELCALLAQMHFGDLPSNCGSEHFEALVKKFYPERLLEVACRNTLRCTLMERWCSLYGSSVINCVNVILSVLGRWWLLGSHLTLAQMRWRHGDTCWIAVNHNGIHLLNNNNMELIVTYGYSCVLTFGGYHDDFMLTVQRSNVNGDEPGKERLTFQMAKSQIVQLTLLIADYIKVRRTLTEKHKYNAMVKQSPRRHTPRKSPHRQKHKI